MHELYLRFLAPNGAEENPSAYELAVRRFPCVVGRHSDCDECLDLPFISRRHCAFVLCDDAVWVEDLGSRNGTYLNGERLQGAHPLQDGDRLDLSHLAFRVRLRASRTAAGLREQPQHVLVVEDNAATAATLAQLLKKWGHEVEVAADGPAALHAVQAHPPDTVLVDVGLPGMDGYQVAQQLRCQPGLERTTLVALTEHGDEEAGRWPETVGFDHLLTKPVDSGALQEVIGHPR
jgi:CheY-like chemotaxis protein